MKLGNIELENIISSNISTILWFYLVIKTINKGEKFE
jgi:hypothetical protein